MAPSEIHRSLLGSQGPGLMFRLNPSLIGPVYKVTKLCMFITMVLLNLNICSCLYYIIYDQLNKRWGGGGGVGIPLIG